MTVDNIRDEWNEVYAVTLARRRASKDVNAVTLDLIKMYLELDDERRKTVDELLAEWLLSDDGDRRFVALALIREHRIKSAMPALRELAERLELDHGPSTPYEWAKVNRVIGHLVG